jgi:hypothetical protein
MAATKWLDPSGWTLLDWEDDTKTVLVDFLWSALKGAADERQAYFESSHSGGFDSDNSFPDFSELKNLINASASSPNNAEKIEKAILPFFGDEGLVANYGPVDHESFAADGTTVTNSVRPDYLTLSQLLTNVLGYASGDLLHMIDTDDGADTAVLKMAWVVQWYQVLNYPQYYAFPLGNYEFITNIFEEIQYIQMYRVEVTYGFKSDDSVAATATALLTEPLIASTPVDIYTSGDLADSTAGVYSTNQEIYDYAVSKFNEYYDGVTWTTLGDPSNLLTAEVSTYDYMQSRVTSGTGLVEQTVDIRQKGRVRFKIKDGFRALSPEKFSQLVYHYFYMTKLASGEDPADVFYSDFGTGINADETELKQFTADADGYYYFSIQDPDLTNFTVPTRPTVAGDDNRREENNQIFTLVDGVALGVNKHAILTKPNKDDDTNFNYYTP